MLPRSLTVAALIISVPAFAHFKVLSPTEWLVTNGSGDPQKSGPCGSTPMAGPDGGMGTASNVITTVTAGSKLTLSWVETVGHPGHYRISLAQNRADFQDPVVTTPATCGSAAIQTNPVAPVLLDGLFQKNVGATNMTYTQDITVPNTPCNKCTIQVTQFMKGHGAPCFYYHCIDVKIVAATDGGTGAGGGSGGGAGGGAAGGSAGGAAGGAAGGSAGGAAGGSAGGAAGGSAGGAAGGSAGGAAGGSAGGTSAGGGAAATGGGTAGGGDNVQQGGCSTVAGSGTLALLLGAYLLLRSRRVGARS